MLINLAIWMAVMLGAEQAGLPSQEASLEPGRPAAVEVPRSDSPRTLSVLISLKQPGKLVPGAPVETTVTIGETTLAKTLHLGDPDVLWTVRLPKDKGRDHSQREIAGILHPLGVGGMRVGFRHHD